ncbi:hypothetical protein [Fictibacillus phosphorivorans]|nr:hypothetical protein [Fictibacillus phosphorivorans]
MSRKQWFPIRLKTSRINSLGHWYFRRNGLYGQVFAIGKVRIVLGD